MNLIAGGEEMLKSAVTASGEGLAAARTKLERKLKDAGATLAEASQPVFDGTRKGAAAAEHFVRGNPWTVAGVAIAAGVVIGFLAAKRLGD